MNETTGLTRYDSATGYDMACRIRSAPATERPKAPNEILCFMITKQLQEQSN